MQRGYDLLYTIYLEQYFRHDMKRGILNYVQVRCASNIPDEDNSTQCECAIELPKKGDSLLLLIHRQINSEPDQKPRPRAKEQHGLSA